MPETRLLLLMEYNDLYTRGHKRNPPRPPDRDTLAARMPGFNKGDCILRYDKNKQEFDDQGLPDVPYDLTITPVRIWRKRKAKRELEDDDVELKKDVARLEEQLKNAA